MWIPLLIVVADLMEGDSIFIMNRYIELANILSRISGYDMVANSTSRKPPHPILRSMVYTVLRNEGHTYKSIGEMAGKNYTTVIWGINALEDMLQYPRAEDMIFKKIYDKFKSVPEAAPIILEMTQEEYEAIKSILNKR